MAELGHKLRAPASPPASVQCPLRNLNRKKLTKFSLYTFGFSILEIFRAAY